MPRLRLAGFLSLWIGGLAPLVQLAAGENNSRISHLRLPLEFEPNAGQLDPVVRYWVRVPWGALYLTSRGAVAALPTAAIRMHMAGARNDPEVTAEHLLPGISNYFIGQDPAMWRTNIPHFGRVRYHNAFPGIDMLFHGSGGELEYDFVLAPGANPDVIRLRFDGAENLTIDDSGDLILRVPGGALRQKRPKVYQEAGGIRTEIACSYVLLDSSEVGFALSGYDRERTLVIDPTLSFSTYLGGSGTDAAGGIAVDQAGNVYVSGATGSPNFPVTTGAYSQPRRANTDVFISKLNPTATSILYSTIIGGSYDEGGLVGLDPAGNIYIAGTTNSNDFPTTSSAWQRTQTGGTWPSVYSAVFFVAKLNPTGSALLYGTYFGGSSLDSLRSFAVHPSGKVYLGGTAAGPSFPLVNSYSTTGNANGGGGFVAILDTNASGAASLVYSTYTKVTSLSALAVDTAGMAYVVGIAGSSYPTTPTAYQRVSPHTSGGGAIFLKLDPTAGSAGLLYASFFATSDGYPNAMGIAVDPAGKVYIAGEAAPEAVPAPTGSYRQTGFNEGVFVAKFDLALSGSSGLRYCALFSGDYPYAFTVDSAGSAYVAGETGSAFQTVGVSFQSTIGGYSDAFVAKLNASGSALVYATFLGGSFIDGAYAIATDGAGNAYIAGYTASTNFPTTPGVIQNSLGTTTGSNAFISKILDVPANCTYSISPTSQNFTAAGGVGSIQVAAPSGCTWTAVTNAIWAGITSSQVGTGNGTVAYDVVANTAPSLRTGTLTVAGKTFTITQDPVFCTISVSPLNVRYGAAGGYTAFTIVTPLGCPMDISTIDTWIQVIPAQRAISVSPWVGSVRTGSVVVANQRVTVTQDPGPVVVSLNPIAAAGLSQTFTFTFADSDGDLDVVNVLFNDFLDGRRACYLAYSRPAGVLYLVDDAGGGLLPGLVLNGSGSVGNGQCTIAGAGSSAVYGGTTLTLTLVISFNQTSFAGDRVIYMAARDQAANNSTWQPMGVHRIPAAVPSYPSIVSLSPASGGNYQATFTVTYRDATAATNLRTTQFLLNTDLNGANACYLGYDHANNLLYLVNDAGTGLLPAIVPNSPPGAGGTAQNGQCLVQNAIAVKNGTDLVLTFDAAFARPGFSGRKIVYAATQTTTGGNSGWHAVGAFVVLH